MNWSSLALGGTLLLLLLLHLSSRKWPRTPTFSRIRGKNTWQRQLFKGLKGERIVAATKEHAVIATTPFTPPDGHVAPFWSRADGPSAELVTVSQETLYEDAFARFEKHRVQKKVGREIVDWAWFEEPDQVNVAVHMLEGAGGQGSGEKVVVFNQTKYGLTGYSLACVGGMIEPGETPLSAAQREVTEEMHMECDEWVFLGRFRVATNRGGGFLNSFLAQGCTRRQRNPNGNSPGFEEDSNPFDFEVQTEVWLSIGELKKAVLETRFAEVKWQMTMSMALQALDDNSGL